jgi:endonuclease/exonuclease/phosphatase family metal-dependent hydrolase
MVKIASFNVENLFARPKAFRSTDPAVGQPALNAYRDVNNLIRKAVYTANDKKKIRDLLVKLDIYGISSSTGAIRRKITADPKWAWLRKNRGTFDREPADETQDVEIIANGRGDWIGWIELATEPVNEKGVGITARVIAEVDADIVGVVEAENRPSLRRFNEEQLGSRYAHTMLIDGNDDRGIDVAILTRAGFKIESICSNVDTTDNVGEVFSRDCPQYSIRTPSGALIHVLVNHFKSQSGGGGDKRRRQATAVRGIVDGLVQQGQHVVVLGDLNEGPAAAGSQAVNLAALFNNNSPLVDCYSLPGFDVGNRPGTYDSCGLKNRLDYILLSKSLQPHFTGGGLFRKGLWGGRITRPTHWDTYPEVTKSVEQASDHALVFVNLNI